MACQVVLTVPGRLFWRRPGTAQCKVAACGDGDEKHNMVRIPDLLSSGLGQLASEFREIPREFILDPTPTGLAWRFMTRVASRTEMHNVAAAT
jgi:hypothetical protein